ncbi:MAG: hypothetical protein ACE5JR_09850 [Gemmatimonadota bacterium]
MWKVGAIVLCIAACAKPTVDREPADREDTAVTEQSIEAAQGRLTERVMALPGVVGTAIGECAGAPCIKVLVAELTADLGAAIPAEFEGYKVEVQETGEIRALDEEAR